MQRDGDTPSPIPGELAGRVSDPAFLGALCHDLRGPLGALGTWLHVLGSGRADVATQQQALAAMQRDVAAQTRLVEQLTDLSAILDGTLRLSIQELDFASLLRDFGVEVKATGSSSSRLLADPARFRQLLAILLPAPAGPSPGPAPVLTAETKDTGVLLIQGLARKGGPGLVGLTLAGALASVQRGRLTIASTAQGTTFEVELPLASA